jgi:hypothetical protein
MLRDSRTTWILTGALAVFAVLTLLPFPPAVAHGGNPPAISRGRSVPGVRVGGPERERTVSGRGNEVSPRSEGSWVAQEGRITPEKLERWRSMPPEKKERIRERYRWWKNLPPERRERILEQGRRWEKLPKRQQRFLRQRREIYRNAQPEEKRAIKKFFRHWRKLPHEQRHALRRDMAEMKNLSVTERDERLMSWPFYNGLSPGEQKAVNSFLFSELPPGPKSGPSGSPRD